MRQRHCSHWIITGYVVLLLMSMAVVLEAQESNIQHGPKVDMSYFEHLSLGAGYSYSRVRTAGYHYTGYSFGALITYRFSDDVYSLRPFIHIFGGAAGMLLGIGVPISTDLRTGTIGLSPQVGISLFGVIDLYYSYSFYLDRTFNVHEVGVSILLNLIPPR